MSFNPVTYDNCLTRPISRRIFITNELVYAFVLTIIPIEKGLIYFKGDKFQASLNDLHFPRRLISESQDNYSAIA